MRLRQRLLVRREHRDAQVLPPGYFCETPAVIEECPKGHYCKEGSVEARACTGVQDCPRGSVVPEESSSGILWFVVISVVAYVVFKVRTRYQEDALRIEALEAEAYHDAVEAAELLKEKRAAAAAAAVDVRGGGAAAKGARGETYRIEFEDIRLDLPNGVTIMRGPSGCFLPGTSTAIMGASGAGKTAIMNLVTGKVKKTSGVIRVNGEVRLARQVAEPRRLRAAGGRHAPRAHGLREPGVQRVHAAARRLGAVAQAAAHLQGPRLAQPRGDPALEDRRRVRARHLGRPAQARERRPRARRGPQGALPRRADVGPRRRLGDELAEMLRSIAEARRPHDRGRHPLAGPAAFAAFHRFLLLQTGRLVYAGPTRDVETYFGAIGFPYPRGDTLDTMADYILKCVAGGVSRPGGRAAAGRRGRRRALGPHDGLHEAVARVERPPAAARRRPHGPPAPELPPRPPRRHVRIFNQILSMLKQDLVDYPRDVARAFCPTRGDPDRPAISAAATFAICLKRACRQAREEFRGFFVGTIAVYFAVGHVLASLVGEHLNVLGGYGPDICAQQYPELQRACLNLQDNSYVPRSPSILFILVAMGAATSAATFGCETAQYWREASTGLHTPAYFFAKVVADVPLCAVSAVSIWGAFVSTFYSPMHSGALLLGFLLINYFGYFSSYLLSFLLPYTAAASPPWPRPSGGPSCMPQASAAPRAPGACGARRRARSGSTRSPRALVHGGHLRRDDRRAVRGVPSGPAKGGLLRPLAAEGLLRLPHLRSEVHALHVCAIRAHHLLAIDLVLIVATKLDKLQAGTPCAARL